MGEVSADMEHLVWRRQRLHLERAAHSARRVLPRDSKRVQRPWLPSRRLDKAAEQQHRNLEAVIIGKDAANLLAQVFAMTVQMTARPWRNICRNVVVGEIVACAVQRDQ